MLDAASSLSGLRRYARATIALEAAIVVSVCGGTMLLAPDIHPAHLAVLGVVVVLSVHQRSRWLANAVFDRGDGRAVAPLHQWLTVGLAAVALAHVTTIELPGAAAWALLPGAVLSALVASRPRRQWQATSLAGTGGVVGLVVTMLAVRGVPVDKIGETAAIGSMVVLAVVGLELLQVWHYHLAVRLDEASRTAAALAVAEERLRFAADLHDTQGHYLEVIGLKADLVERLVPLDPERAGWHAVEIAELARRALVETRGLVRGYRSTSLSREIDNAIGILEASGVELSVDGRPDQIPHELQPLFAALVREGATNILRHSEATRCRLEVTVERGRVCVRLHNDRPHRRVDPPGPSGCGLAGLRERFAAVGGTVYVDGDEDGFALVGHAPVGRMAPA